MKTTRYTESQIVAVLKQSDAGLPIKDICRQAGISQATYYQWKSKYGGMEASDLKRVKELESENAKLKRMFADLALENAAMEPRINVRSIPTTMPRLSCTKQFKFKLTSMHRMNCYLI